MSNKTGKTTHSVGPTRHDGGSQGTLSVNFGRIPDRQGITLDAIHLHELGLAVDAKVTADSKTFSNWNPDPVQFKSSSDGSILGEFGSISLTIVRVNNPQPPDYYYNYAYLSYRKITHGWFRLDGYDMTLDLLNASGGVVYSSGYYGEIWVGCQNESKSLRFPIRDNIFDQIHGAYIHVPGGHWKKCG